MVEPNVRLVRVVAKGRDNAVSVTFVDRKGKVVSLAFDGRYDRMDDYAKHLSYVPYTDCPIIDGDGVQRTDAQPLSIIRNLRDALNALDLGE
jgi:hypothetical protein